MLRIASCQVLPLALVACQVAPRIPSTTLPGTAGNNLSFGVGITTAFGATLTENGKRRDIVPWNTKTLAAIEMITVGFRHPFGEHCDVGGQVGIGQVGADARCGVGSATAGAAIASGVQYQWWGGVVGRTELQLGANKDGWLGFVSTGISYGFVRYKIPLDDREAVFLSGPPDPSVVIHERELGWTSTAAIGVPLAPAHSEPGPSAFLGLTFDKPLVTSAPQFSCEGCAEPRAFDGFSPGLKLGVLVGLGGRL